MARVEKIYGNTYRIITKNLCVPFYRLNQREIVLMDSGFSADGDEIAEVLEENQYKIKAILTTHAHYDHIGNHNRFQKEYGAEVYMSVFDAGITQSELALQGCFYTNTVTELAETYPFMICKADHILPADAETVWVDDAWFQILNLPGHAHSHWGFITPDEVAYLGDLLIGENDLKYMSLLFGQCWSEMLKSIDAACQLNCRAYVLAHNDVCNDIHGLAEINRSVIFDQAKMVLSYMEEWVTRDEVIAAVIGGKQRRLSKSRIRMMTRILTATLNYLEDTGRLEDMIRDGKLYQRAVPAPE